MSGSNTPVSRTSRDFLLYLSVDARISKDIKVSDKYTLRFSVVRLEPDGPL